MRIDIVSDTICPWCFIGKRRLERALAARPDEKFEIGWRPFQLNPDMPAEGMDRRDYLAAKFGGAQHADQRYQHVIAAGADEGIAFNFDGIKRTPNTLPSHRLIRWSAAAGIQNAMVEALFRRYFLNGADISNPDVLADVAKELGMDGGLVARMLSEGADEELVRAEDKVARDMGIQGVPCFIVERKYAISGAQDPSVFLQVFDLAAREAGAAAAAG